MRFGRINSSGYQTPQIAFILQITFNNYWTFKQNHDNFRAVVHCFQHKRVRFDKLHLAWNLVYNMPGV